MKGTAVTALALLILGVVVAALGARCAGQPAGYSMDRTGALGTVQPPVPGTVCSLLGWLGAELMQVVGYVIVMMAFLLML